MVEPRNRCQTCGSELEAGARFCGMCGSVRASGEAPIAKTLAEPRVNTLPGFIGRRQELDRLPSIALNALHRRGQRVVVQGPSGIGKTAFLEQVTAFLSANGFRVISVCGRPECGLMTYFPFQQILAQVLEIPSSLTRHDLAGQLAGLKTLALTESDLYALSYLFPVDLPATSRQQFKDSIRLTALTCALLHILRKLALQNPLAIVLDRLHESDPFTRHLLERLNDLTHTTGLLILQATREELPEQTPTATTFIRLNELEKLDLVSLACSHLNTLTLPIELEQLITTQVGGNPGLVKFLLDELRDVGYLTEARGVWRCHEKKRPALMPITISQIVKARFERLSVSERDVAGIVAAAMGEATTEVVESLAAAPASARQDIAGLAEHFLLDTTKAPSLSFPYSFLREHVYGRLNVADLQAIHPRLAAALNQRELSLNYLKPWIVSFHGIFQPDSAYTAAPVLERTGDSFARQLHPYFALQCYKRASHLLRHEMNTKPHNDLLEAKLAYVLSKLARLSITVGDTERARKTCGAIVELADNLKQPYLHVEVAAMHGELLMLAGRQEEALAVVQTALEVSRRVGDDLLIAEAKQTMAAMKERQERLREAEILVTEAVETWRQVENDVDPKRNRLASLVFALGQLHVRQGKVDLSLADFAHAREYAETSRQVDVVLRAVERLASITLTQGDSVQALAMIEHGFKLARSAGDWLALAGLSFQYGRVQQAIGDRTQAEAAYLETLRLARETNWTQGIEHSQHALAKLREISYE